MRVALVHYWLLNRRGGEKVLEAISNLFPEADIFTLFYDPEKVSPLIRSRNVHASYLNPFRKAYRSLLPLMPMALESFDLREYDLVISSESGPAKGVLTHSTTRHICYCHTPMRYLWDLYPAYRNDFVRSPLTKLLFDPLTSYLRTWDYSTAARVDGFMANSANVKRRIWKTYRRKSRVVHPPVATHLFRHEESAGYCLTVGELVPYKQLRYVVSLFTRTGRNLKVVGQGSQYRELRGIAGPNIEFCGAVPDAQLQTLYARCLALIVPGEEDFGIASVEALASGKPVVALARGGSLEIVRNGCGVLYAEPTEASLENALRTLDQVAYRIEPARAMAEAANFSDAVFRKNFLCTLERFTSRCDPPAESVAGPALLKFANQRTA